MFAGIVEKWHEAIGTGGCFGVLLTDISKAFDSLLHHLFIAKLWNYGVDRKSLKFIKVTEILVNKELNYSSIEKLLFGISQGSILGYFQYFHEWSFSNNKRRKYCILS